MSLAQILSLDRPLVLIDLETTGGNASQDRIVQIGLIKIYPDGTENEWMTLVNPEVTIPPEMTEIHGISNDDVLKAPIFKEVAGVLLKGLENCYVGGYNVQFDLDFLDYSFYRIRVDVGFDPDNFVVLDAFDIFKHFNPRNLSAAVKHYLGKELHAAHSADIDINATKEVLEAQLQKHELPTDIQEIQKLVSKKRENYIDRHGKFIFVNGVATINFGKHKGKSLGEVPKPYFKWMSDSSDFSPKVMRIVMKAIDGVYPEQ